MDSTDPADPIDKIEPVEPMERIDPLEPRENSDVESELAPAGPIWAAMPQWCQ